jgi:poly-gamma-glutamate synthesis protein (capsule biosynthesis protein)
VVVLPHWGEEYTPNPTRRQRELARFAIESGATLIAGNHAHVVAAAGPLGDGYIAYALGNFVFDQDWSTETTEGVVLEATFRGSRLVAVQFLPVRIRNRLQPVFLGPDEGRAILKRMITAATRLAE